MTYQDQNNDMGTTKIFRVPSQDETIPDLMNNAQDKKPTLTIVKGPQSGMSFTLTDPQILQRKKRQNYEKYIFC